jgi:hypothetical protein
MGWSNRCQQLFHYQQHQLTLKVIWGYSWTDVVVVWIFAVTYL